MKDDIVKLSNGQIRMNFLTSDTAFVHLDLEPGKYTLSDHRLLKDLIETDYMRGYTVYAKPQGPCAQSAGKLLKILKFKCIDGRNWFKRC